jgi:ribosomal protein S27E
MSRGPGMRFYDVYWTIDDLSVEEKESWKKRGVETGERIIGGLPGSFGELTVECPCCGNTAMARTYGGSWNEARCKACGGCFMPSVGGLVRYLYEGVYEGVLRCVAFYLFLYNLVHNRYSMSAKLEVKLELFVA